MAVTVLLFASARERAGGAERVVVQTPCGDSSSSDTAVSVAAVVAALREMHPQLGPVLDTCMYAVDMEYVDAATALVEAGGELAVIPPVMNSPRTGKRGDKQTNAAPQTRKYLSAHRDALHSQLSKTVKQRIAEAVRSKILDLSSLGLSLLPEDAKLITDLRVLLLGANNFTAVPANLANTFPSLEYLDLSHNSISSIPSTLADLPELRVLDLSENPGLAGSIVPAAYAPLRHQLALFVDDENIEFKEDSQGLKDESRRRVTEDDYENGDEGSEGQADDSNGDDDDGGSDMSRGSFRKQNDLLEDAALSLHKFLRMVKELEDAADLQSLFSRLAAAKDPIFFKYLSKRYPKGENLSDGDSVLSVDSDRSDEGFALRQRSSVEYDRKEKEKYVKASREVGRSMKTSRLAMD